MMHNRHPKPGEREEFLVDGCPRCAEYARDLGLHFDEGRFRAFWAKMVKVEFDDGDGYASQLDKELGRSLYYVALGMQRAFGLDPHVLVLAAPLLEGIRDDLLVLVPRLRLGMVSEHASNARTALTDPAALGEAEYAPFVEEERHIPPDPNPAPEGSFLFAVSELDEVINTLRPFCEPDEEEDE